MYQNKNKKKKVIEKIERKYACKYIAIGELTKNSIHTCVCFFFFFVVVFFLEI